MSLCGHILFIRWFVDGSLGYFCILVTVNSAAMNFLGLYLFELVFCFVLCFSDIYSAVESLGYMVVLFLDFEKSILFSKVTAPVYIPLNRKHIS